jgi:acetaldehyde dehydrogenase (acetylating)
MRHYATSMILATGGAGMVKAAHSVGKPALGVGPGNVPVYVDRSADVARAAADIVNSKAFDCSTICATEQTVVADRPSRRSCAGDGGRTAPTGSTPVEAERSGPQLFRAGGLMDARYVGRSPQAHRRAGRHRGPRDARILVADLDGVGPEHPLSREKLTTVLGLHRRGRLARRLRALDRAAALRRRRALAGHPRHRRGRHPGLRPGEAGLPHPRQHLGHLRRDRRHRPG